MKQFAVAMALILSMIASGAIDIYPETAKITCLDYDRDLVTVECGNGNCFQFYGTEDYDCGDLVSMLMYGKNTPEVTDDEIIKVQYAGFHF